MTRQVYCVKLKKSAEGLAKPPFPGEMGQKIFDSISKEAWALWQARQIMFINEYRLPMTDPKAKTLLRDEMQKFLFTDLSAPPPGYQE